MKSTTSANDGRAVTSKSFFSRQTTISVNVAASAERIWKLLTDADNFSTWNSTIVELTGAIIPGGRVQLRSALAPGRTFKLRVKDFDPNKRLSWGDAMGTRTYILERLADNRTRFTMTEIIGGPLFPLFARMIPSFDESFNRFAADLKSAAEENK